MYDEFEFLEIRTNHQGLNSGNIKGSLHKVVKKYESEGWELKWPPVESLGGGQVDFTWANSPDQEIAPHPILAIMRRRKAGK